MNEQEYEELIEELAEEAVQDAWDCADTYAADHVVTIAERYSQEKDLAEVLDVIKHTNNLDAYFDELKRGGVNYDRIPLDTEGMVRALAFSALELDLLDAIALYDELPDVYDPPV